MKFKKVIYAKAFDGAPKKSDFEIEEEDVGGDLKDNEFLYEALYISCDPYTRLFAPTYKIGDTIIGFQLSKVIKSKNPKYPVGFILVMNTGWRTGGKSNGSDVLYERNDIPSGVSLSAGLGIFAMTGFFRFSAYYGIKYVCQPKPGNTLLVSGATGAVGQVAGQLGKIMGCKVIGSAGSPEKIEFLKSIGYDEVFNYKKECVGDALKRLAPDGIDVFFDNVGGDFCTTAIHYMNKRGRIAVCGTSGAYNAKEPVRALMVQSEMPLKCITMQGFNIFDDVQPVVDELYCELKKYVLEGKLKQVEHITEGFENLPEAFIGMLESKYLGKVMVKM